MCWIKTLSLNFTFNCKPDMRRKIWVVTKAHMQSKKVNVLHGILNSRTVRIYASFQPN